MPLHIDGDAFAALRARLDRMAHADPTALLERGERIMAEDNERGILAGTDKHGKILTALRSRRKGEYEGKTGPPLAPSGANSRVIKNFVTGHLFDPGTGRWMVVGAWEDVVSAPSKKGKGGGVPFLDAHFNPKPGSRLPRRDLAGVRPQGRARWSGAVSRWVRTTLLGR